MLRGECGCEGEPVVDELDSPEEGEDRSRDGPRCDSSRKMRESLGWNGEDAALAEETA